LWGRSGAFWAEAGNEKIKAGIEEIIVRTVGGKRAAHVSKADMASADSIGMLLVYSKLEYGILIAQVLRYV
jgi:hypothetical protein